MGSPQAIQNPFESQPAQASGGGSDAISNPFESQPTAQTAPAAQPQAAPTNVLGVPEGGVRGWLHDLEGDIKYGGERTIVGRLLKKAGAQPTHNGVSEGAADFMSSPVTGSSRAVRGGITLQEGAMQHDGDKAWQGTKDLVGGTLEATQIPGGFIAPEAGKAGAAALSEGADAVGNAVKPAAEAIGDLGSRIKRYYSIPESATNTLADFEKTAPGLRTASEAAPAAEDLQTAQQSAKSINSGATQQVKQRVMTEFQGAANDARQEISQALGVKPEEVPLDISNTNRLSDVADRVGKVYRNSAQQIYKVMDEIAGGTHFQDLAQTVDEARSATRQSGLTDAERMVRAEKLVDAEGKLRAFTEEAAKQNVNLRQLKGASDKLWSKGMSFDEIAWRISKGENLAGELKPSARPLDTIVRDLSTEASNRGHVLKNAMGEARANTIVNHATDAATGVENRLGEVSSAKTRIAQTKAGATEATAKLRNSESLAKDAQRTVDKVNTRRWRTAEAALGGGALIKGASALYGNENK